MKKWIPLAVFALLLTACQAVANEAEPVLRQLLSDGKITKEQYTTLLAALSGDSATLLDAAKWAGNTAVTLALGYLGIRKWRGTPGKRKGSAPTS